MLPNSLYVRLLAAATVTTLIVLALAGFLLNAIFVAAVEKSFDQRLQAALDGFLANIEIGADGKPHLDKDLADARFSLPLSGWYWQVSDTDNGAKLLSSPSLLEQRLDLPDDQPQVPDGQALSFSMQDKQGANLRVIEQDVKIVDQGQTFRFMISGNFDEVKNQVEDFRRTLFLFLGGLGLALLALLFFLMRLALRPLGVLQHQLNEVRSGGRTYLEGNFPAEVRPLANELNLVVQSNTEIIERARMQVGNLAHALKTPLSVLNNEARNNKSPLGNSLRQQLSVMREQVDLYLDRARRAARAHGASSVTEVEPVAQGLARTLTKLRGSQGIAIEVHVNKDLKFRGERQDLEEMLGNLLDNATKWAKSRVVITAENIAAGSSDARSFLLINVDDDGPGIPPETRPIAMQRGKRLDETVPGTGLGLSIIAEAASMYGGTVSLHEAPLGGLRATLKLPAAVG